MLPLLGLLVAAATPAPTPTDAPAQPPPVEVHGEVRARGEGLSEIDLDPKTTTTGAKWGDGERLLLRTRFGIEGRPTSNLSLFAQVQDARIFGQESTTATGLENLDLRQGWVEVHDVEGIPVALRVGRMELVYGDQRLLGSFGWDNVGRSFDAIQARAQLGEISVDGFFARLHADPRGDIARTLGDDLVGVYGSWRHGEKLTLDAYVLGLYDRGGTQVEEDGTVTERLPGGGDLQLYTPGIRVDARPVDGVHLNGEFAGQVGTRGALDVAAWALHASADYTFAVATAPRVLVGYDRASGDKDPTDKKWGTFENLFPTNHDKYGLMDLAGWKNLSDAYVGAGFNPVAPVALNATVHLLARAESSDTFYRANGTPLREKAVALETDANDVGTELDLTATWAVTKGFGILAGYSQLWSGGFLDETSASGEAPDPGFGYLQLTGAF